VRVVGRKRKVLKEGRIYKQGTFEVSNVTADDTSPLSIVWQLSSLEK
jgi:hypothetical protein